MPTLYKHHTLSGPFGRTNFERAIIANELRWQTPRNFNDPFDCLPYCQFGSSEADRRAYAADVLKNSPHLAPAHLSHDEAIRRVGMMPVEMIRDIVSRTLDGYAISCFTTTPDNMLMWSHYSDNHSGICYFFEQMKGFIALPVEYSDDRPIADVAQMNFDKDGFLKSAILTKPLCWEYEHERRMFEMKGGAGPRTFPREALKGVILGATISDPDRDYVLKMIADHRPDLTVMQAKVDDRHYRLNISAV